MNKLLASIILSTSTLFSATLLQDPLKEGERIYKETCMHCHGVNGKPKEGTQLVVNPRDLGKTILSKEQTFMVIKEGARHWGAKADMMPSFKYVYSDEQIEAVTLYISKNFNPDVNKRIEKLCSECEDVPSNKLSKMLKRGKKIYNRNCKFCHGEKGEGNGIATKNPVDSIYPYNLRKTILSKKQIFLYTKYGGKHFGTAKEDMPSWKRKYDDFTLRSVAKYIDEVIKEKNHSLEKN